MTVIQQEDVIQSIADALQYISYYHPTDFIRAMREAWEQEESPSAKAALTQVLVNSRMCAIGKRPICQDTGFVNVLISVGMGVRWDAELSLEDMINEDDEYFTINFLNASENAKLTENKVDVIIANSFIEEKPPKIINVAYLKETQKFEITWSSNPGTSYIISSSDNLEQWTHDLGNEVIANHTEMTISLSLSGKKSQYFRVNIAE